MIKDKFSTLLERTDNDELFKMLDTMFTDEVKKEYGVRIAKMRGGLGYTDDELPLFIDNVPRSLLRHGLKKNFTREMLIDELKTLSENTQEGLIKYYQEKNRKIDVLMGIIGVNSNNQLIVRCPLAIYSINKDSLLERDFHSDEQVFGVIRNDNFCILEEIKLKNGEELFGYVATNNLADNTINLRLINGFEKASFSQYSSEYDFGELLIISKNEIEKRN